MTALERIKEIEKRNRTRGPIPDSRIEFLLRAFNAMWEVAKESNVHIADECWGDLNIDEEFERRMGETSK